MGAGRGGPDGETSKAGGDGHAGGIQADRGLILSFSGARRKGMGINMNKILDHYEAEHIYLSKACDDDCEAMFNNIWSDEEISKYMNFKPIDNFEDAKEVLRQSIEYQKNNMGYFVYLKENREAIGFAGIKRLSDGVYGESGLCIARKYQGKGYGKELLLLLQGIVFKELQGTKFVYACMRGNEKSKNLCLSLGYRYDRSETVVRKWDNYAYISDYYILSSEH